MFTSKSSAEEFLEMKALKGQLASKQSFISQSLQMDDSEVDHAKKLRDVPTIIRIDTYYEKIERYKIMTKEQIEAEESIYKPEPKKQEEIIKCSSCHEAPVEVKLNDCCDHIFCGDCFFILSSNGDTCPICTKQFKTATHLYTNKSITME
eukprot:gene7398-11722_t